MPSISSHSSKLYALVVEKTEFALAKAKLDTKTQLTIRYSIECYILLVSSGYNNKKIHGNPYEMLALVP